MESVLDKIDYAARKTLEVHNDFNMGDNFRGFVSRGYDYYLFTSTDGARDAISSIAPEDFVVEMIKFALEAGKLYETIMELDDNDKYDFLSCCTDFVYFYKEVISGRMNPYVYLNTHTGVLSKIAGAFGKMRYHHYDEYYGLVEKFNIKVSFDERKIENDKQRIKNLRLNARNANKCLLELEAGKQMELSRSEYSLDGKMFSVSDIGNSRDNQEDATLIMHHPENPNYRLVAVADGVGGLQSGEIASSYTLTSIAKWFEELDVSELEYPDDLNPLMCGIVSKINKELFDEYHGDTACTLVFAVVANGKTVVVNVGDSRAYIYKDKSLSQLTVDDSVVFDRYLKGIITKDDIRFEEDNNYIKRSVGGEKSIIIHDVKTVGDYDLLLFFTDGVTDILTDDEIKLISETTPVEEIAKKIVEQSLLTSIKKRILLEDGEYEDKIINGGKDNTTAAVLVGKR